MQGDILLWENYFLDIEISVGSFRFKWHTWENSKLGTLHWIFFLLGKIKEVYRNKKVNMVDGKIVCISS